VRRFGDDTEIFIDRAAECTNTIQLNAYGFGAKVLASLTNGRIESYLDAYTLEPDDIRHPLLVPRIAKRLAEYHACNIQHISREPGLWPTISKWYACSWQSSSCGDQCCFPAETSACFQALRCCRLHIARDIKFDDAEKAKAHQALDFDAMTKEVARTKSLCDSTHSPVVFCHNDLLSGNIMLLGGSKERSIEDMQDLPVQLIDYEYGCYSYRGFDWGAVLSFVHHPVAAQLCQPCPTLSVQ
jgi:ethanolamine kinase